MTTRTMAALLLSLAAASAHATTPAHAEPLQSTIAALDAEVFAAFNACADSAQLERHAGYFAEDVEFYHDHGGVTWDRSSMLENTRRYACGHYRRELLPDTLEVFPIKDFGALARGVHRFCQSDTGRCDGEADFTILWRQTAQGWRITRVLSYGHRPSK